MNYPPRDNSEDQLLQRARQGDQNAFASLYNKHKPFVLGAIRQIVQNNQNIEDIAQVAFTNAFRGLDKFKGTSFKSWLRAIAQNAARDYLRKIQRELDTSSQESPGDIELIIDTGPMVDEQVICDDLFRLACEQTQKEFPTALDCYRLCLQGYNIEEIAIKSKLRKRTVEKYISKALNELRKNFLRLLNDNNMEH